LREALVGDEKPPGAVLVHVEQRRRSALPLRQPRQHALARLLEVRLLPLVRNRLSHSGSAPPLRARAARDFGRHRAGVDTRRAPATSAASLPKATSRGRYFIPQSGAATSRAAGTRASAARNRPATCSAVSIRESARSITPSTIVLFESSSRT